MFSLVKNVLRGVKRRIFQYFSIIILLILIVAAMSALYSNSERLSFGFSAVAQNSGTYDYRIQIEKLNSYKEIDNALNRTKTILKNNFQKDLVNYNTIINQIDKITNNDIENNLLPTIDNLDDNLRDFLLNWGINYQSLLINDILNNEIKNNPETSNYQIKKSFLKSFDSNQAKKIFFSFEDAFYLQETPPWLLDKNLRFDFSPYRNSFNQVYISEGKKPQNENEVVVNPIFAKKHKIALNDQFTFLSNEKLKVVGFGYSYWGILNEPSIDNISPLPENTTQVFTTREWLNHYLINNSNEQAKITTNFFLKVNTKDNSFSSKIENIFNQTFNFNYGSLIINDKSDYRSGFLKQTFELGKIVYSAISFIVMLAAIFIVLSYVKKEVNLQKKQLGLIKGLGYNNYEIVFGFTFLIFLISIFSTIIGFALSLPLQEYFNNLSTVNYVLPLPTIHFSFLAFLVAVVLSTIIFTFASYLQSWSILTKNPLVLIYNRPSNVSTKWLTIFKKPFNHWNFKPRLAVSFALKSGGKLILIFLLFIFVSFLLLFQTIIDDVFTSKINNLQSYVNSEVYLSANTFNMYKFDNQNKITTQVYDWVFEKNLNLEKEIKANKFQIDSEKKFSDLTKIILADDFRDFYIKSEEMNLLYNKINNQGVAYIRPLGTNFISATMAETLYENLTNFFDLLIASSGIDFEFQSLPGISIGQVILNSNYYPNLEFVVNSPTKWIDHNQGSLLSKSNQVVTLYNNEDNLLAWKNWFNLKVEQKLNIDEVFNSSHNLKTEQVSYIDSFGQEKNQNAYVIPAVISKSLAVLNKYKVNDQVLMILNANANFLPIVFDIKGIITTNLDSSQFYTQIDDLRRVIGYTSNGEFTGIPIKDSFNNYYSKNKTFLPLNNINIVQSDNNYSFVSLQNNWKLIDRDRIVFPLMKDQLIDMFHSVQDIVSITKWITIVALGFVLFIIVSMILDNNLIIIAMMKASGYRTSEINSLITGAYILTLVLAFVVGTVLGYLTWWIILIFVAKIVNMTFLLPISFVTILLTFALIFLIIAIGYMIGLYFIKFKPITNLLQSD
ncbi:hypothetical protein LT336_00417 [Spiroplasma sp. JKS002671]|uniref:ABC transporter permease n=1 Tax=Spiroplasma attinicola TaxID=2904537 RepID=UPI002022B4D9|nr:ABC transporter permease [Spiroplasma sp. JKS002671]MCL8210673.1 hypothetical protein [Spiroplasma sp. JKS002671]